MVRMVLSVLLFLATAASAQTVTLEETSSPNNPAQVVENCVDIGWDAPTDIVVHHYHFYSGGILRAVVDSPPYTHCLAERRVVEEIRVKAAPEDANTPDTAISDALYLEWVDRQCLTGIRVVPCP